MQQCRDSGLELSGTDISRRAISIWMYLWTSRDDSVESPRGVAGLAETGGQRKEARGSKEGTKTQSDSMLAAVSCPIVGRDHAVEGCNRQANQPEQVAPRLPIIALSSGRHSVRLDCVCTPVVSRLQRC